MPTFQQAGHPPLIRTLPVVGSVMRLEIFSMCRFSGAGTANDTIRSPCFTSKETSLSARTPPVQYIISLIASPQQFTTEVSHAIAQNISQGGHIGLLASLVP